MDEKTAAIIKQTIEELLVKMGFDAQVVISESEDDNVICDLQTQTDSHFLIGQHGVNLQALQHLVRLMVRKHVNEKVRFTLDVNNYRQQKNESVVEQAKSAAEEALREHRSVIMKPMSTYERRLVHMELAKNDRVTTESTGEGEDRKIIVKPVDSI